jgi:transcriptional regulator with XRE-family HTH domain
MDYWARIEGLLVKREWNIPRLAKEADRLGIDLSEGTLYQARSRGGLSLELALRIAATLGITVDELLDKKAAGVPPEDKVTSEPERALLICYRQADSDRKDDLLVLGQRWAAKGANVEATKKPEDNGPPNRTPRKPLGQFKRRDPQQRKKA